MHYSIVWQSFCVRLCFSRFVYDYMNSFLCRTKQGRTLYGSLGCSVYIYIKSLLCTTILSRSCTTIRGHSIYRFFLMFRVHLYKVISVYDYSKSFMYDYMIMLYMFCFVFFQPRLSSTSAY